jgi:hypothetical protein
VQSDEKIDILFRDRPGALPMLHATRILVFACLSVGAVGCSTVKGVFGQNPPEEFSVHYEPGSDDPADADREAEARCAAYGLTAVFIDETQDSLGRLRHRHYRCE